MCVCCADTHPCPNPYSLKLRPPLVSKISNPTKIQIHIISLKSKAKKEQLSLLPLLTPCGCSFPVAIIVSLANSITHFPEQNDTEEFLQTSSNNFLGYVVLRDGIARMQRGMSRTRVAHAIYSWPAWNSRSTEQLTFWPRHLTSAPVYTPHFSPHSQTPAGRPRPSWNYLARQDLSPDGAAHECLHILPRLLLLHRRGGVEGDLHHGESSGCAVRRGSNQYPGLQVGRGGDRASPSST